MRFLAALIFLGFVSLARAQVAALTTAELDTAKRLAREGQFPAALASIEGVEKARKPSLETIDLRGAIYVEQGKYAEAAQAFAAARAKDPLIFAPRLHAADSLLRQHKYQEALDVYSTLGTETNVLVWNERLRYATLIACLGLRNEAEAKRAYERIKFPTETPAYYYAQAAWDFAHGRESDARKWMKSASRLFDAEVIARFARPLYELGWIKTKPAVAID
jgi:tetratricopeptide (TPR) repeat protein